MTNHTTTARCTWQAGDGAEQVARWVTPEGADCTHDHCAMRGRCAAHVDLPAGIATCPRCIGRTRRELQQIHDLAPMLPLEAKHAGLDSEAANLAGPAASAEQMQVRAAQDPELELDPHHPHAVLGRWDLHLRDLQGTTSDLLTTLSRAVDFLLSQLALAFPHGPDFEAFATDVSRCLDHMLSVLHDARQTDQGAHCPTCLTDHETGPRLRKRHAEHGAGDCPALQGRPCRVCTGMDDTWHCPAEPSHWWSEPDYRARITTEYLEHAEALTASDAAVRLGVAPSTVRVWVIKHSIRFTGTDPGGRRLYQVAALVAAQQAALE